ncbi:MAG: lipopolysaccharide biosynthesis protein [Alphaproteobacteria bacterium]|nr:lipopolysaccharide biosynthesis protein [Alphaproteobacteria bacterium]MBU0792963.1 lipopolysaccharide biosynthesis protein [Alphaproteobacteria bacterium]MBU0875171.1 lipopolysaccharide biosynthesis protein [Alphaproteobacteria bacterium]MBU1768920.1 lipopolysaccharide biosynthesis protein [Alphaproteobacteria bacterium]
MNNVQAHYETAEDTGGASFLPHIPTILLQRKWLLIIPALLLLIAAVAAAFLMPVQYQSKAVLLVEASLLPEEVVGDTNATGVVDQRMARIRQQVLSRPQLVELIQRNSLYQTELRTQSLSEVIATMRESISIEPVTADIQAANGGRRSTIAFSMSFNYSDPVKAQAVAQALTDQVLQLDASTTAAQSVNTIQFLTDQEAELQTQIAQLDQQIADIQLRNGLTLASSGMSPSGNTIGIDSRIAALQSANAQLQAQRELTQSAADRDPVIADAESALAAARARYTEQHPDVVLAKQRLAEARELAKTNQSRIPTSAISSQIASNNREIARLEATRAAEESRSASILNAQIRAPVVQQELAQLQERMAGLNAQYQRVSSQLMNAKAGKRAEDEQQGERLSVIDPPVVPDEPYTPNRPRIIMLGAFGGLGLGLGLIFLIELFTRPIRGAEAVLQATGAVPLVVIPTIVSRSEQQQRGWKRLWPFGSRKAASKHDDDDDD